MRLPWLDGRRLELGLWLSALTRWPLPTCCCGSARQPRAAAAASVRRGAQPASAGGTLAEYVTDAQAAASWTRRVAGAPAERRGPVAAAGRRGGAALLLREQAAALGAPLPLDRLAAQFALDPFELGCVLLCAAPELDSAYERIFGYVLDDISAGRPSVELLLVFAADDPATRLALRPALGPFGPLRRHAVLEVAGDAPDRAEAGAAARAGCARPPARRAGDSQLVGDPAASGSVTGAAPPAELEPRACAGLGRALLDGR